MGYLYLLCVALMFSFGGTFVRLIKPYYSSSYITWFRFLMGVLFLILLKIIKRQRFPKNFGQILKENGIWIVFGAVAKWLSYTGRELWAVPRSFLRKYRYTTGTDDLHRFDQRFFIP